MRLVEDDNVTHVGAILANDPHSHTTACIKATCRAFYALQGAGLCVIGSATITHVFNTVVRPVVMYGLECVYQTKQLRTMQK